MDAGARRTCSDWFLGQNDGQIMGLRSLATPVTESYHWGRPEDTSHRHMTHIRLFRIYVTVSATALR